MISEGGEASREDRRDAVPQLGARVAHQAAQGAGAAAAHASTRTARAEFRANIVRNLDEFHEVFETAEGDGLWLDPGERVRIW